MNVFLRVLGFQKDHLGNDQARYHIVDCRADENDPLFEQPGKNIEGALTAACLFDNHRNELVVKVVGFVRMNHVKKILSTLLVQRIKIKAYLHRR